MIELKNVRIDYPLLQLQSQDLRARVKNVVGRLLGAKVSPLVKNVTALHNINITIRPKERVGIIGPNGAGKTTLLRTLGGIFPPSAGSIRLEGKINNLIETGLGMERETSGIQNIIVRFIEEGLTFAKAKENVDEVVAFADIGDAIYDPVYTYSTGMVLRLAFAIETYRIPEILIMDEIIGAGDEKFQTIAIARINEIIWKSKICIISSHDLNAIRRFCNRCLLMEKGRIIEDGAVDAVIRTYLKRKEKKS